MNKCHFLITALLFSTLCSCGRGGSDTSIPVRDSTQEVSETDAVTHPDSAPAAALLGDWELDRIPTQRMPGLNIRVTIDSVTGVRYFGRLSQYFSGNVGQDPRDYVPFSDSIHPGGLLTFAIPSVDLSLPSMVLEGKLTADTIELNQIVFGPDTIVSGQYRWVLVRRL